MSEEDEILGCDYVEHNIKHTGIPKSHVRPFSGRVSRCSSVAPSAANGIDRMPDNGILLKRPTGSSLTKKEENLDKELTEPSVDSLARHLLEDGKY